MENDQGKKEYEGYIIEPVPLQTEKGWQLVVNILVREGDSITHKPFSTNNFYETEKEAIEHCYNFARQIIDGECEGLSV